MSRPLLATLIFLAELLITGAARSEERIDFATEGGAGSPLRVRIELEAGGHSLVRPDGDAKSDAAPLELPMSVNATLQYRERAAEGGAATGADGAPIAVRYYEKAEAVLKVGDSGRTPKLPEDRRLIVVAQDQARPALYCPDGPLTREQLDLIDAVGVPNFIDQLLPTSPVAKDGSWSHDASVIGPLLTLDSVAVCEVKSTLDAYNASFAKLRLAGNVHGMVDGAATELDVRAVYLFDRRNRRVSQMNLAVRERRSIGGATPGLNAVAKLQIRIEPVNKEIKLDDAAIATATQAARDPDRDLVYESTPLGLRFHHDRKWFITSEQRETVTLRRVDEGNMVAQCTLTALPPKSAGHQTTLEQFQKDVEYSLGKSFGEMVSSREWQNEAGLYCYQLTVRGVVDEVPVEWHYYLASPGSGDRVSAAVTVEKPMVERLGKADGAVFESLQLFPRMKPTQTAARPKSAPRNKK